MGLLAGEKRKQKIGLDPNNLTWRKDTTSVGQSMLKKMGWKEGAGLGANEDGRVVPVKASMKSNTAGLGCSAQHADSWIAHGEEFDQILASLNASTKSENDVESASDGKPQKEKMEGQRRFYGRFSRGGVKQQRTAEDLDCIFGRRKASAHTQDNSNEETISEESNDSSEDKDESQDQNIDKSHGVETVISNYSVQDYFAQKLKKLKQKKEDVETLATEVDEHVDDKQDNETKTQDLNSYVTSSFSVNDYFSRKMKVRNEKLAAEDCKSVEFKEGDCEKENSLSVDCSNADEGAVMDSEEANSQNETKLKKKKKKKRKTEDEDAEIIVNNSTYDENNSSNLSCSEEKAKKKKKKKRKHEDVVIENDDVSNVTSSPIVLSLEDKTEKKKKRKTEDMELNDDDSTVDVNNRTEEKSEKKKKKKKRKTEDAVQDCDDDLTHGESASVLCTDENIKKKKKRKCEK